MNDCSKHENFGAVLHGVKDLRIEPIPVRKPAAGEVQLLIEATTLCGSDAHYYNHARNGSFQVLHPLILGHEATGKIIALGDQVKTFSVGDRVALECGVNCGRCDRCKEGRYNLCPDMVFRSSAKTKPHADGTLCKITTHPASMLHALPANMSPTHAALLEPLSVVLHSFNRLSVKIGSSVLVIGAGPIGLLTCALAKTVGCAKVCLIDVNPARIEIATDQLQWVTEAWTVPRASADAASGPDDMLRASEDLAKRVLEKFGLPGGFDQTFECTGVESCIQTGIHTTRAGGKLALVGMGTPNVRLPLSASALREVDIVGVFRYANCYPAAIQLLSSHIDSNGLLGRIDQLVSHQTDLADSQRAFQWLAKGQDEDGKPVIKVMITQQA